MHFFNVYFEEGYPCVRIFKIIRCSSLHICYYVDVLKNVAKFKGTHFHRSLFSTCNLQIHWKRDADKYSFLWVLQNILVALLLWKTFCELVFKFYEKRRTALPIIIKIYREVDSFFKNCEGKCIFENIHLLLGVF